MNPNARYAHPLLLPDPPVALAIDAGSASMVRVRVTMTGVVPVLVTVPVAVTLPGFRVETSVPVTTVATDDA